MRTRPATRPAHSFSMASACVTLIILLGVGLCSTLGGNPLNIRSMTSRWFQGLYQLEVAWWRTMGPPYRYGTLEDHTTQERTRLGLHHV